MKYSIEIFKQTSSDAFFPTKQQQYEQEEMLTSDLPLRKQKAPLG